MCSLKIFKEIKYVLFRWRVRDRRHIDAEVAQYISIVLVTMLNCLHSQWLR